jgi:hypothetical protein
MDLITLFDGIEGMPKAALDLFRKGACAREVAEKCIEPHITAIDRNAGQAMDPGYVAYLLEFVIMNSSPHAGRGR